MTDRLIGKDPDDMGNDDIEPLPYVQAEPSGGTMTAGRSVHPYPAMEASFKEAEAVGFRIEQRTTSEWGMYFRFEDDCDPPHLGTVNEKEVYAKAVEKILKRCPKWRAWKTEQEGREET
jgi:hypothetical protein